MQESLSHSLLPNVVRLKSAGWRTRTRVNLSQTAANVPASFSNDAIGVAPYTARAMDSSSASALPNSTGSFKRGNCEAGFEAYIFIAWSGKYVWRQLQRCVIRRL